MTADEEDRGSTGAEAAFEALDPKLTIYALANGMDLVKTVGERRLEWYRDGRERGIVLRGLGPSSVSVAAVAWKHGDPESLEHSPHQTSGAPQDIARNLAPSLQSALNAANAL